MAKEVEKEAVAKEAAEKEGNDKAGKWTYSKPLNMESKLIHAGEKKVRIDIPKGKDADGKTQYEQWMVDKGFLTEKGNLAIPPAFKHDAIQVKRVGEDKFKNVKDPNELVNGTRAVQKKSLTPKKDKTADKAQNMENEGRG